ncbi:hypothetical protein [Peribacillus simplex]|uniref:hypothetical protein n=1 Tax=Peribacillus simplex TaxID=1478 RepID=UPI0024C1E99E|nr:hypothetical protein [Peribacillus simplex]WHY54529.1 hypothetical protein QNH43_15180 [Peribacillus simplex]
MKINIFGVGCSGTKAVQLYLAYLIGNKEGVVKVNYEPYYWMNRKLTGINQNGIHHHINSDLINTVGILNEEHSNFLLSLLPANISSVTKFIRANGRIKAINKIMKPDFTIVIIRNLYEVLNSLSKFQWDLLGEGLPYPYDWDRLIIEVQEKNIISEDDLNQYLKVIKNKTDKNAFYWYVMNLAAIASYEEVDFFLDYSDICQIEKFVEYLHLFGQNIKPITDEMFEGKKICEDSLLVEVDEKQLQLLNVKQSIVGTIDKVGIDFNAEEKSQSERSNFKKEPDMNDLYEYFNQDIKTKLTEVMKKM